MLEFTTVFTISSERFTPSWVLLRQVHVTLRDVPFERLPTARKLVSTRAGRYLLARLPQIGMGSNLVSLLIAVRVRLCNLTVLHTWSSIRVALVVDLPRLTREDVGLRHAMRVFRRHVLILKVYCAWADVPLKTSVTIPLCTARILALLWRVVPSLVERLSRQLSLVPAKLTLPRKLWLDRPMATG